MAESKDPRKKPSKKPAKRPAYRKVDFSKTYLCMECGSQLSPIEVNRGSWLIEIVLWLCYILPGVIYSIWRRVRKKEICRKCRMPSVERTNSERVLKMQNLMKDLSDG